VSRLTYAHIQQREGRWAVVDLVGKGRRVRTVPMPPWTKVAIDAWVSHLEARVGHFTQDQRVFRAINKGDKLTGVRKASDFSRSDGFMSDQAIADVVKCYCDQLGFTNVAAHDLRRTFAKLARKGGAEIDQIQLSLGHASIQTTERYLGTQQDMNDAPADRLGIELEK
jgi:integrase